MDTALDIDPGLFGLWPAAPVYDGLPKPDLAENVAAAPLLDTKAGGEPSQDDLQSMLNAMTKELRERFQGFQKQRLEAEAAADAGDDAVPGEAEARRKLAQADAKAAIDAISLIVRTLEKIDSLQRTIAHDRQMQAEQDVDAACYDALVAAFETRVSDLAERRAVAIVAAGHGGGETEP